MQSYEKHVHKYHTNQPSNGRLSDINNTAVSRRKPGTCEELTRFVAVQSRPPLFCDVSRRRLVEASWNVMAHAQKPGFVFRRNGRVHLNRRARQFRPLLAAEVCASAFIVASNAGYTMFRGSVKGTGYPLHSPVSPSLPFPCVTVCHHISTGLYAWFIYLFAKSRIINPLPANVLNMVSSE